MMRYLLDTSALLAHFRQEAGLESVQTLFEDGDAELLLATVTLAELGRRLRELGATENEAEEVLANYDSCSEKDPWHDHEVHEAEAPRIFF